MSDSELRELAVELKNLVGDLNGDLECSDARSMKAGVLRALDQVKSLREGHPAEFGSGEFGSVGACIWLIGNSVEHLDERTRQIPPNWDQVSADLAFLESGVDQLLDALSESS